MVDEEKELSSHLLLASSIGFGKTRRDVRCLVESHLKGKGILKGSALSNGWWQRFLQWNKTLSLCLGDSTACVRMNAMTSHYMKTYFERNI